MKSLRTYGLALAAAAAAVIGLAAAEVKVDLSKEVVGKPPKAFQAMVGTWIVVQDGPDKVIKIDGAAWKAAQTPATKMLIENARKLYGTNNEDLMDNAKMFANFPVAVLNGVTDFSNGTLSLKFKTISGDSDRASGILFNVKPNGDWLSIRFNDTESNVVLWEFHNGIRRSVKRGPENKWKLDPECQRPNLGTCGKWHELKATIDGADFKAYLDGELALEYTLGTEPGPGRNGAPPNDELFPKNNAVLRPPVMGGIGLWAKTDTTSLYKDFTYSKK